MPTAKPRVNVTMGEEEYALLTAFAARQGMSRGAVLMELWRDAMPVMARILKLLEEAEMARDSVREGIRDAAISAELEMMPLARQTLANLDLFEDAVRKAIAGTGGAGDAAGDAPRAAPDGAPDAPEPPSL